MTRTRVVFFIVALLIVSSVAVMGQAPWYRQPHLNNAYNLAGTKILIIVSPDFNPGETIDMAECWKNWGAQVEYAGPGRTLTGEAEGAAPGEKIEPPTVKVNYLLEEVDPSKFDVLYFAGGEGVPDLLAKNREQLARIIDGMNKLGKVISALCHGPMALAAASSVKGKRITVQGSAETQALEQAGAILQSEITVVDGQFVTGQWPHLETFAVVLAERVQFPNGGGPYQKILAARTAAEQAVDDMRLSYRFETRPVPADALDRLARAAQKAFSQNPGLGSGAMKLVSVKEETTKAKIADIVFERMKARIPKDREAALRNHVDALVAKAPVLVFQFVVVPRNVPAEEVARAHRVAAAFAGGASANMMLVARSLGLGMGLAGMPAFEAESELKELVKAPESAQLVGVFCVGYPSFSATPNVVTPASEMLLPERWNAGA